MEKEGQNALEVEKEAQETLEASPEEKSRRALIRFIIGILANGSCCNDYKGSSLFHYLV